MSSRSENLKQHGFLKILAQMELALAYGCPESVDRESLVEYIHHNRDLNARRIGTIGTAFERIENNLTDQEQMISNNTDHIVALKEEVKSNANIIREKVLEKVAEHGRKLEDAFEVFKREVQAIVEKQNRKIEDQENMIETLKKKLQTEEDTNVKLQSQISNESIGVVGQASTSPATTTTTPPSTTSLGSLADVKVLVRKNVGNPADFFHKSWSEYKDGFSANGESWLGLESLHKLTIQQSYKLKITLTDFDGREYVALYDQFKVGPEKYGYRLSVTNYNADLSTLGDSMNHDNGQKFSTRDRDQDLDSNRNCAEVRTGGWWYFACGMTHLTGQNTDKRTKIRGYKHIFYYYGGERGNTYDSWAEAEMVLVPN